MPERSVKVRLDAAVGGYVSAMARATGSTKAFGAEVGQVSRKHRQEMQTIGTTAVVAGGAIAVGMGGAAKAAMDFESSFAGVRKTVDASEAEFAAMEEGFRGLAREIPISVNELNGIGEAAGQLGIAKENILDFSATMADLGVATNLTADEAATAFARFANITGMPQDDFDRLGSTVVELGNNLATTESEISEFAMRLAGAGAQIGLTEAEILGLGGALSSVGINAEAGGTAISKVMIDITSEVETGGDKLALFAQIAGQSANDFATSFRDDPAAALAAFIEGLGGVEAAGGSLFSTLEELGITEQRMRDALLRTAGAGTLVADSMGLANDAFEENTALTEEAEQRYSTLESRLTLAKNAIEDAGIALGETLTPALGFAADAVAGVAGSFADLPGPAQGAVAGLGGVAGTVSLASGAFLLAAPRIVETKDALTTLSTSMPKTTRALSGMSTLLTGPWGIAIAGATAAVGLFAAEKGRAQQRIEEVIVTLDEETGALTGNTDAWLSRELQQSRGLEFGRRLGLSAGTVMRAAKGEADALEGVNAALTANIGASGPAGEAAQKLEGIIGSTANALEGSQEQWREQNIAIAEGEGKYLDLAHALDSGLTPAEASARIELQALSEAAEEGGETASGAIDPVTGLAEGIDGVGGSSESASGQLFLLADSLADTATETEEAVTQMEAYEDMIKRNVDPVYDLRRAIEDLEGAHRGVDDAQRDLADAQENLSDVQGDSESTARDLADAQRAVEDAERGVEDATWDVVTAVSDLETSVLDGNLSFDAFEGQLRRWVAEGRITEEQAGRIREGVADLKEEADKYHGSEFTADFTARLDRRAINDIERELSYAARTRTATVNINSIPSQFSGMPVQPRAKGGDFGPGWLITGEQGPELTYIGAGSAGTVIPAPETSRIMGGGSTGGGPVATMRAPAGQGPSLIRVEMPQYLDGRQIGQSEALIDAISGQVLSQSKLMAGAGPL